MLKKLKEIQIGSKRLYISPLMESDAAFVLHLFNTEGWLEFIGDRNIHNINDAQQFISNACENSNVCLWVVCLIEKPNKPIGLITLIKREYLVFPDIGYALLPNSMGNGYAKEAVEQLIQKIASLQLFEKINAITLPNNTSSIKLLEKLNFKFEHKFTEKNEELFLYQLSIAV